MPISAGSELGKRRWYTSAPKKKSAAQAITPAAPATTAAPRRRPADFLGCGDPAAGPFPVAALDGLALESGWVMAAPAVQVAGVKRAGQVLQPVAKIAHVSRLGAGPASFPHGRDCRPAPTQVSMTLSLSLDIDHVKIMHGTRQLSGIDMVEEKARAGMPDRQGLSLLPSGVSVRMAGTGGLGDHDVGAGDQLLEGRCHLGVAGVGQNPVREVQAIPGAAAAAVVEAHGFIADAVDLPRRLRLQVAQREAAAELGFPLLTPAQPEQRLQHLLHAGGPDHR